MVQNRGFFRPWSSILTEKKRPTKSFLIDILKLNILILIALKFFVVLLF